MLNGKFAMALAAAMVLATLYGCSSNGVKNQRDALQVDLDAAYGTITDLQEKLATVNDETIPGLEAQLATITGQLATVNDETIPGLEAQLATITGQLATANDETIPGLEAQLATARGHLATANDETIPDLEAQLATARGHLATANDETIPDLEEQLATARGYLATANDETIPDLEKQLATAKGREMGFTKAQEARDKATSAAGAATKAVTRATEASQKLDAVDVAGESEKAVENAELVLTAKQDAGVAVDDATEALRSAAAAKDALGVDADSTDVLTRALDDAIEVATGELEKAKKEANGKALKDAVERVTGIDPKKMMGPADSGEAVATAIFNALALSRKHSTSAPPRVAKKDEKNSKAVQEDDPQGTTWKNIVGAENVTEKRIASEATTTVLVSALSIKGWLATDVSNALVKRTYDDGEQFNGMMYTGIMGTVFCASDDCKVTGNKLAGAWFFTPDSPKKSYVEKETNDDVTSYEEETEYAQFGYWLNSDQDDKLTVHTYASAMASDKKFTVGEKKNKQGIVTDTTATYTGDATGISSEKIIDDDGGVDSIDSGKFTADVKLVATFGSNARLRGTVENFRGTVENFQGKGVDTKWSVTLDEIDFTGGTKSMGNTKASGSSVSTGTWEATAYGDDSKKRPIGIFGGFYAEFTDGAAAGAYTTRKQ